MIPVRGAILGPEETECDWGGATEASAVAWPPLMKERISPLVTLPLLPVPGTELMSMPSFFAKCLTAGVDKLLPGSLPGGAVAALLMELVGMLTGVAAS